MIDESAPLKANKVITVPDVLVPLEVPLIRIAADALFVSAQIRTFPDITLAPAGTVLLCKLSLIPNPKY